MECSASSSDTAWMGNIFFLKKASFPVWSYPRASAGFWFLLFETGTYPNQPTLKSIVRIQRQNDWESKVFRQVFPSVFLSPETS